MPFNPSSLLLIASFFQLVGEIIIAIVVVSVHFHLMRERKIDADVIKSMMRERALVYFAIFLIVASFLLELLIRVNFG